MTKYLTIAFISLTLAGCQKAEKTTISTPAAPKQKTVVPVNFLSKEVSVAQMSEILKPKQNDTLYVTNFFATWCGPCMGEIPHFKEQMKKMAGKPVKFTFVSLDGKSDWDSAVRNFAEDNGLTNNVILLDNSKLDETFFKSNFKSWDGSGIPFTHFRKGDKTDEYMSAMTPAELEAKINALLK